MDHVPARPRFTRLGGGVWFLAAPPRYRKNKRLSEFRDTRRRRSNDIAVCVVIKTKNAVNQPYVDPLDKKQHLSKTMPFLKVFFLSTVSWRSIRPAWGQNQRVFCQISVFSFASRCQTTAHHGEPERQANGQRARHKKTKSTYKFKNHCFIVAS